MSSLAARLAAEARQRLEAGTPGPKVLAPAVLAESEELPAGAVRALPVWQPYVWDAPTTALIDRFAGAEWDVDEPFALRPGVRVVNMRQWVLNLWTEIWHGPEARRSHTGDLALDLEDFLKMTEGQ